MPLLCQLDLHAGGYRMWGSDQMRALLALTTLNVVAWGAFVAIFPGSHFAWPSSYKFWWFDDLPWCVMAAAIMAALLIVGLHLQQIRGVSRVMMAGLTITLLALLPYIALSGGGV